jgi:hypothetical protein
VIGLAGNGDENGLAGNGEAKGLENIYVIFRFHENDYERTSKYSRNKINKNYRKF